MKGRSRDNACLTAWAGGAVIWLTFLLVYPLSSFLIGKVTTYRNEHQMAALLGFIILFFISIGLALFIVAWIMWCHGRGQNALWPILWALFYILLGGGITAWIATHSTNGSFISGGFFVIVGLFLASQHLNVPDLYQDDEKRENGQRP